MSCMTKGATAVRCVSKLKKSVVETHDPSTAEAQWLPQALLHSESVGKVCNSLDSSAVAASGRDDSVRSYMKRLNPAATRQRLARSLSSPINRLATQTRVTACATGGVDAFWGGGPRAYDGLH